MENKKQENVTHKRVFHFSQILPNNQRVRSKLELEKLEEEERLKFEYENQKKKEEFNTEEIQRIQQLDRERKQKLKELENKEEDKKDRTNQLLKMEGNLSIIIRQIQAHTSPYELNFAGINLDRWNFTTLLLYLPENRSLLTLNLSRKKLDDGQAAELAEVLKRNKRLRRLELEGNEMGPEAAKSFAEALKVNRTLRYLDLENNNLTNRGDDSDGIVALFDALRENTMLISLNLTNNYLTPICGQAIMSCLRKNKTLINLETFQNQRFEDWNREDPKHPKKDEHNKDTISKFVSVGLSISQIKDISERISENKTLYDNMRKDEWIERKNQEAEHDDKVNFLNVVSQKENEQKIIVDENQLIEKYYMDNFSKNCEELEKKFTEDVNQYFVDTKARLDKKGGKKGKSGGKKSTKKK